MLNILSAVKTNLQVALASDVRSGDIYVTPHVNYIPRSVKMPCVAIADGGLVRRELSGGAVEATVKLRIVVYVDLAKDEAAILGDESTDRKGLIELAADIHDAVVGRGVTATGVLWGRCPAESPVEIFGDESNWVCRKILDYEFDCEW